MQNRLGYAIIILILLVMSQPSRASDLGCQILLCLSNPGGPTEFAECEEPIAELFDTLHHCGRPPSCPEANLADWSVMEQITSRSRHPRRCFGLVGVLNGGSFITQVGFP
jgi:hypothetical protein